MSTGAWDQPEQHVLGDAQVSVTEAWERYAEKARPRRRINGDGASTWLNWTQYPDHGPNESVLGDLSGRRVLELGSGTGSNLAHLATLGAVCTGGPRSQQDGDGHLGVGPSAGPGVHHRRRRC